MRIIKMATVEKINNCNYILRLMFSKSPKNHHSKIQLVKAREQSSGETGLSGEQITGMSAKHGQ